MNPSRFLLARFIFAFALVGPSALAAQSQPAASVRDTVSASAYQGWKQYSLHCARCHGEDGLGTSFGPDLIAAMRPGGAVPSKEALLSVIVAGRPDKGMPPGATLGLGPEHHAGIYEYLSGRSSGRLRGGRPVPRER